MLGYRSYLDYANWYVREANKAKEFKEAKESIRQFRNTYMYVKKYEHEYGAAVLSLCSAVEKVALLVQE